LPALPSQLPKPELHELSEHVPVLHEEVALARLHGTPQALQLLLVRRLVSQPLALLPSQLPNVAAQFITQAPAVQAGEALVAPQTLPQVPQFAVVFSAASQPLATLASQLPKPELQVIEQAPSEQPAVPLTVLHAAPQAPQCAVLVCVLISQPSPDSPLQLPKPELQVPSVQVPVAQDSDAFARSQSVPQPPQLLRLVSIVSQPLPELPSQSPRPALQLEMPQVPFTQFGVPPVAEQTLPHVPQ
jgi:hypothetical protein